MTYSIFDFPNIRKRMLGDDKPPRRIELDLSQWPTISFKVCDSCGHYYGYWTEGAAICPACGAT
jgi:hypothetical protein